MVTLTAGIGPVDEDSDRGYFLCLEGPATSIMPTESLFETGFTFFTNCSQARQA